MDKLSSEAPGFISLITLVEVVVVLQSCYTAIKPEIISILDVLLRTQELKLENAETVVKSLGVFSSSNADFSGCLIE